MDRLLRKRAYIISIVSFWFSWRFFSARFQRQYRCASVPGSVPFQGLPRVHRRGLPSRGGRGTLSPREMRRHASATPTLQAHMTRCTSIAMKLSSFAGRPGPRVFASSAANNSGFAISANRSATRYQSGRSPRIAPTRRANITMFALMRLTTAPPPHRQHRSSAAGPNDRREPIGP
jgi:hypothetical protein